MEYKYQNLKNKKEITINIDKKYSFIYGPNGTGKTTFSKAIGNGTVINDGNFKKIHFVFNQDFVNNNIYISTSDGIFKSDVKNQSKLKQIFLGNTSKDDNENLNFIRQKIREYNKLSINLSKFKDEFKNISINQMKEDKRYLKEYDKFIMSYISYEYLEKYFKYVLKKVDRDNLKIDSLRIEDEDYIQEIKIEGLEKTYSDNEVINELFEFCKKSYDNKEKSINKIIDNFNEKFKKIFNVEELIIDLEQIEKSIISMKSSKEIYEFVKKIDKEDEEFLENNLINTNLKLQDIKKWISKGNVYHNKIDFKKCLYCRNSINQNLREDKRKLMNNKYILFFNEYRKNIDKLLGNIENMQNEYENLVNEDVFKLTKRERELKYYRIIIKKKEKFQKKYNESIEKNNYYEDTIKVLKTFIKMINNRENYLEKKINDDNDEGIKYIKAYQNYLYSEKFINEIKIFLIKDNLKTDEEKYKKKIKEETERNIEAIKNYVNIFEKIYEPRFKLKIKSNITKADKAQQTMEICSDEINFLNNISEGEKNVLALIIFFSYVQKNIDELKENEKIVLVLDDPVNSNDWSNFFKFQAIIEDYFYSYVRNGIISNIIILSHNIDYAIIQLENDKYTKNFEFIRLFSTGSQKVDTEFIFMDDIKLGSKLIHELYDTISCEDNIYYVQKQYLYRVVIYMRKFLESLLNSSIAISNPYLSMNENESIKFLKDNIKSNSVKNMLSMSTKLIKDINKEIYTVDIYMRELTQTINDIIDNSNLFSEDSKLKQMINKYIGKENFCVKGENNQYIRISEFKIEKNNQNYDEELIDIMLKGIITNINAKKEKEKIEYIKAKSKSNLLKYMRHINDNVGRPVLAVNSDLIIDETK